MLYNCTAATSYGMEVKGNTLYSFKVQKGKVYTPVLVVFGVFMVALIAYFAYSANYLATLIFTLVGFIVSTSFFQNKSRIIAYRIKTTGIQINNMLYPYEHLKSFWIFSDPLELSVKSKKALTGYIKIPLGNDDVEEVRIILSQFLKEKKHKETISDAFLKVLGL